MLSGLLWSLLTGCPRAPAPEAAVSAARAPLLLHRGEDLTLSDGTTIALDGYLIETLVAPDGSDGGGAVLVTLLVDGQAVVLFDGPPELGESVGWVDGLRLSLGEHHADTVQLLIDRRSEAVVPGSTRQLRIQRGETADIGGGVHLSFLAHSHKSVLAGGPPSPLIVSVEYLQQTAVPPDLTVSRGLGQGSYSLYPPASWLWRDYRIQLIDHHYNAWMNLEIVRLEMVPVQ